MDLSWIIPKNVIEFSLILLGALALDALYPYHSGVMYEIHPVHTAHVVALALYKRLPRRKATGIAIWIAVVLPHVALYTAILYILNVMHRVLWILFSIYILKVSTSLKLLVDYVWDTYICLRERNTICARKAVSNIVRRDVERLGEGHIASAAVESLFESLVDGFTSPLLYYLVLGSVGALVQRLVNAMDSTLGYKDANFKDVGWFSAKADTLFNFVPARLTALITLVLCPIAGGSIARGWSVYLRDRNKVESVNAGNPMAVAAGCLGVRLEKIGSYTIGEEFSLPVHRDVLRAIKLTLYISIAHIAILHLIAIPIYHLIY